MPDSRHGPPDWNDFIFQQESSTNKFDSAFDAMGKVYERDLLKNRSKHNAAWEEMFKDVRWWTRLGLALKVLSLLVYFRKDKWAVSARNYIRELPDYKSRENRMFKIYG